jgi:hypothetical protein
MLVAGVCTGHPKPGAHADIRIRVDDDAVRISILMNCLFADQIVKVPRMDPLRVSETEAAAYRDALREYFGGPRTGPLTALYDRGNVVRIDGVVVPPMLELVEPIHPQPETRPGFVQNPVLLLPQLHIEVVYSCKSKPRTAAFVWGSYPRDFAADDRDTAPLSTVEAVLLASGRLDLLTFTRDEPEYVWHAIPEVPKGPVVPDPPRGTGRTVRLVSWCAPAVAGWLLIVTLNAKSPRARRRAMMAGIAAAGWCGVAGTLLLRGPSTPELKDEELLAMFRPLHANIYRAFDYASDNEIYDVLAQSIDGPLLDQVFSDTYRSLVLQEEGGALCRVKTLNVIEANVLSDRRPEHVVLCRWEVEGVVYHWGHSHARTNAYTAEYDLGLRPTGWRIVGVRPLHQEHVMPPEQADSPAAARTPAPAPSPTWKPDR